MNSKCGNRNKAIEKMRGSLLNVGFKPCYCVIIYLHSVLYAGAGTSMDLLSSLGLGTHTISAAINPAVDNTQHSLMNDFGLDFGSSAPTTNGEGKWNLPVRLLLFAL